MKLSIGIGLMVLLCTALAGPVCAQNASTLYERAEQNTQSGKWSRAIGEYRDAIKLNPRFTDAYIGLAHSYNNQADYTQAIAAALKATQLAPNNMLAYYNLGAAYYQKKMWPQAQDAFNTVYKLQPDTTEANIGVGLMYLHFNHIQDAIKAFNAALVITPDSAVGHLGLGMAHVVARNRQAAQSQADVLSALSPTMATQLQRAILKIPTSDSTRGVSSEADSTKSESQPKSTSRWPIGLVYVFGSVPLALFAGWFLYMRNRPMAEPSMTARADVRDPNSLIDNPIVPIPTTSYPRMTRQSMEILPPMPSNPGGSVSVALRPRPEAPALLDTPSHIATSTSQLRAGHAHYKAGKYQEALEAYKDSIRMNPNNQDAFNGIGQCYAHLESWDQATGAYKLALRINPDNANVHCNMGDAYLTQERFKEALEAYKQAIRLTPNDAKAHFQYGMTSILLNDKATALDEFKMLKKMSSEMANNLFNAIYPS
jgi:tetratricopeptide (TPR) repeat protein